MYKVHARSLDRARELELPNARVALRKLSLFCNLPPDDVLFLLPHLREIELAPGQVLVEEGDVWEHLAVVQSGYLEVFKRRGEHWRLVLFREGPGAPLMVVPVLDQRVAPTSVRAVQAAKVLLVGAAAVRRLLATSSEFALHLTMHVSSRTRKLVTLTGELSLLTLEERLVRFVLRHAPLEDDPSSDEEGWDYTHEELADLLGGCREEITRLLSKLKRKRLVATGRRRVRILDFQGLQNLAPRLPGGVL